MQQSKKICFSTQNILKTFSSSQAQWAPYQGSGGMFILCKHNKFCLNLLDCMHVLNENVTNTCNRLNQYLHISVILLITILLQLVTCFWKKICIRYIFPFSCWYKFGRWSSNCKKIFHLGPKLIHNHPTIECLWCRQPIQLVTIRATGKSLGVLADHG